MRWLVIPESPEHVLTYVDYVAQEVGIAAALSGDPVLRAVYETEDAHLAFAIRAGAAPAGATKESHPEIRKRYKTVSLGVLYGQTAFGVSARLGIPVEAAQAILDQHRGLFPTFWAWSERVVQAAFDRRKMRTPCGWASSVPPSSNERTWMNFPVQATGGDIMRLTVTYLDRQNVALLAPVHDGFLLSCRRDQLADLCGGRFRLSYGGRAGPARLPVALGDDRTRRPVPGHGRSAAVGDDQRGTDRAVPRPCQITSMMDGATDGSAPGYRGRWPQHSVVSSCGRDHIGASS